MKILLIEDDQILCSNIKQQLTKEGYIVDACHDGGEGLFMALNESNGYDLAVIDRMLPGTDGMDVIKTMRRRKIQIPIIIITGMSELQDKIDGLDTGADDYLTKPFHIRELSARIRALTRRPAAIAETTRLSWHDLSLEPGTRQLQCGSSHLILTPTECHLMSAFLKKPDTLLTREQLMQKVWEINAPVEPGNLDNYIYFLRKRLRTVKSSCVLSAVYGSGYLLTVKA